MSYLTRLSQINEPATWKEIDQMVAAEATRWREAAKEEIETVHKNDTWTLTKLLPGKKAIG